MKPDVEKVLAKLGIDAVRRGRDLWALCPFHEDTNPTNWHIKDDPGSDKHGFHNCFACGSKGGLLGLVAHVLGLDPEDSGDIRAAFQWLKGGGLADPEQLRRPTVVVAERRARGPFRAPKGVRFGPLRDWPKPAVAYLEDRGLSPETVEEFGLGYAVDGRLANRLFIPVRNRAGAVMSYTARSFTGDAKRYLEPKEDEGASPRAVFGEHLWPPLQARPLLFVLEGAFDAMAVRQQLAGAVVAAIFGNDVKVNEAQLGRLATFERIVVVTDADAAGNRLAKVVADVGTMAERRLRRGAIERVSLAKLDASAMARRDPDGLRSLLVGACVRSARSLAP